MFQFFLYYAVVFEIVLKDKRMLSVKFANLHFINADY